MLLDVFTASYIFNKKDIDTDIFEQVTILEYPFHIGLYMVDYNRCLKWCTLGARDFSSAVSGFCQVFIVTRAGKSLVAARIAHYNMEIHPDEIIRRFARLSVCMTPNPGKGALGS